MKRFYKSATVKPVARGYAVQLDGKPIKTPLKADLVIPTEAAAELVASEWNAQGDVVEPKGMVSARLANTAIDRVAPGRAGVIDEIAAYGGSDLVCYRADHSDRLAVRQAEVWDPYLGFAAGAMRAPLMVTTGVMQITQPEESLKALHAAIGALTNHQLSAFFSLVTGLGSLVLGFALTKGFKGFDETFIASQLDALFQEEEWGTDAEAEAARRGLQSDLKHTFDYFKAATS